MLANQEGQEPVTKVLNAFLITQHYHQRRDGIELQFWLHSEQGPLLYRVSKQDVVFFVCRSDLAKITSLLSDLASWHYADVELKNLDQQPVAALYFLDVAVQRQAINRIEAQGLVCFEPDVRPTERFLMERFITGSLTISGQGKQRNGFQQFDQAKVKASKYSPQLKVLSIDIETSMYGNDLFSIGLYGRVGKGGRTEQGNAGAEPQASEFKWVLMRGDLQNLSENSLGQHQQNSHWLKFYKDERQLMEAFIQHVQDYDPDLIIGWNVINFDLRFLLDKAKQLGMRLTLGRAGGALYLRDSGSNLTFASLTGRAVVDGIDCLRGATYHFESYALDNVAHEMLGRGKNIHDVDNRGEEITRLFREDKLALAQYNLEDCRLVLDIFDQAGLIEYLIARAHMTGLPLDKIGGSSAAFDNLYLPRLHRYGFVAPVYASGERGLDSPGGYVMDSRPGLYDHVLVLDFKSLYPSIMCTFKIDPLGLAEGLAAAPESDRIPGFNQAYFHRTQHILPDLLETLWHQRDNAKAQKNAALSQAIKIIMNSFYGVLGSDQCRFFDQRLSGSITLRGHQILTQSRDFIQGQGFTVIYGDTDSLFVWIDQGCDDAEADRLGHRLARQLNDWWTRRLEKEFNLDSHLEVEYETHYRRFLMPTIRGSEKGSKKRYAGVTLDTQGEPQLIFKGLESVRSDWTPLARRFQQELYRRVFFNESYEQYVREVVAQLYQGRLDEELVYRKRLRQPLEAYTKTQPPHVQAAKKSLQVRLDQDLPPLYRRGSAVPYLITVNGPEPIDAFRSIIDYDHYLDKQLVPVADSVLAFLDSSMEQLLGRQIQLF